MKMRRVATFVLGVLVTATASWGPVHAQDLVTGDEVSRILVIRNLKIVDGAASGVLVNKSTVPLESIRLLIRHTFLWKHERRPARESANPSRAVYYQVAGILPPAGVVAFSYTPDPPLPKRKDGRFRTYVEVFSLAEAGLPEDEENEQ